MEFPIFLLLFGAGLVCGGLNAVAGGATLLGFPVLLSVGLPPPVANASNFVATVPGYAAAIPSCLRELRRMVRQSVIVQIISATAGATLGSILLVLGDSDFFTQLVPWLLLIATALYAGSDKIGAYFSKNHSLFNIKNIYISNVIIFFVCIYGGYFGAGLGIIVFALLKIIGYNNFHDANALKNVMITAVSLVSIGIFSSNALIAWPEAGAMMFGSALGGYYCAKWAKKIPQRYLHRAVVTLGMSYTLYAFAKI